MRQLLIALLLVLPLGCATMNEKYTLYDTDGVVTETGRIRSTVIGTGETTLTVRTDECGVPRLEYTTRDTGLSEEGGKTVRFGIETAGAVANPGSAVGTRLSDRLSE